MPFSQEIAMKKLGLMLVAALSLVGCAGQEDVELVEAPSQEPLGTQTQGLGCATPGDGKTSLRFINRCGVRVHFAGNGGMASGSLAPNEAACRTIGGNQEHMISRRYWGWRDGQDPGAEHHSLAEFGFNENFAGKASWDWFNLSQVDAHNLPLKIIPYELGTNNVCDGQVRACAKNLLADCPESGKLRRDGKVIACVNHDRDNPNGAVSKYFNNQCPGAYSWSGDDAGSMASCNAEDFDIVFCPE
jgi:hypothetical protein